MAPTTLILAIEPDKRQASQLTSMARQTLRAEIILADSAERALASLGDRVPDLILTPALLSPRDESAIAERLRQLNSRAAHVRTLTVPVLAAPRRNTPGRGVLSALRRDKSAAPADGCDPDVFAEQVAEYLERATAERAAHDAAGAHHTTPVATELFATPTPAPAAEPTIAAFDPDPYVASVSSTDAPAAAHAWTPDPQPVAPAATPDEEPATVIAEPDPYLATAAELQPVADPYVATIADPAAAVADEPYVATVPDPVATVAEPTAPAVDAPAPVETVLPVLEFLVQDEAILDLQASLEALDVVDAAGPVLGLTDEGFEGFDPQMLSAELPDAFPVIEVVTDELDDAEDMEAAAEDEIDLGALLDEPQEARAPRKAAPAFEPAAAAAIMAAVAAVERSMAAPPPESPRKNGNGWVPLRFESHQQWPRMEGMEAEAPAPGTVVEEPEPAAEEGTAAELAARQPTPLKKKKGKAKPAQDEWGLFDPAQCGFAALLAKLEEITEKEDARSA